MSDAGPAAAARNLGLKAWRRLRTAHKPLVRLARRRARREEQRAVLDDVRAIERQLAEVAAAGGRIAVGPWLAEVGYEVLYWVPFVRWFADAYRIPPERLVVISRGGAGAWYRDVAGSSVEIFDLVSPAELAALNDARMHAAEAGGRKQTSASALDEEIVSRARRVTELGPAVLHPSLMFRLFRHVWHGEVAYDTLWTHTRHASIRITADLPADVPAAFSVVKFYTGVALPAEPWIRERLQALVAREAAVRPVIVLDAGVAVDEHEDYAFAGIPNVISAARWMTPATNLALQTALIARAHLFLSTCGGLAWLAPMLGTPTVAVYADDRQLAPHLYVAAQAARRMDIPALRPLDLRAEHLLGR